MLCLGNIFRKEKELISGKVYLTELRNEKVVMKKYDNEQEAENENECLNILSKKDCAAQIVQSCRKKNYIKYCENGTLEAKLHNSALSPEDKLIIIKSIVKVLCICHSCNIAHLDVKLSNLCFDDERLDSIKLIDFAHSAIVTRPLTKHISMSWEYLSPEIIKINEDLTFGKTIDPSRLFLIDVWCVGVIIVKMFFPLRMITIQSLLDIAAEEQDFFLSSTLNSIFNEKINIYNLQSMLDKM